MRVVSLQYALIIFCLEIRVLLTDEEQRVRLILSTCSCYFFVLICIITAFQKPSLGASTLLLWVLYGYGLQRLQKIVCKICPKATGIIQEKNKMVTLLK